jgi:hypothetical protein
MLLVANASKIIEDHFEELLGNFSVLNSNGLRIKKNKK